MKKFLISVLLVTSAFFVESVSNIDAATQVYASTYNWSQISKYGDKEWVLYDGWQKLYGWQYVDGQWYYLNAYTGYMAHDTFVDGYYINSNGEWTNDIPYEIQKVRSVIKNKEFLDKLGNDGWSIKIIKNQNLKKIAGKVCNPPDENGTLLIIGEGGDHFLSDNGTVYKVPYQAGISIKKYDDNGNVVKEYPYIGK